MNGQFAQIQTKALFDKRLKSRDRDVILLLQSMSGVNGYCWPSYNHIADKLGISRKTAIEAIKKLENLNYIVKVERTIDGTNEQTSNKYYVNNNPDAGIEDKKTTKKTSEVVKQDTPPNNESVVQNLHHPPVQNLHPEKEKFFEKNARACARTREGSTDTPKGDIESGLMPEAKPDNSLFSVPYIKSSEEEIRLCKQVSAEWKRAFNKSLWTFGEILKSKQHKGFYFRVIPHHESDFDFDYLKNLFADKGENVVLLGHNDHFADEERINYDD